MVEAVFDLSGLAERDKWQSREDYRARTVMKACEDIGHHGNRMEDIEAINQKFAWDLSEMSLYNIETGFYVQRDRFTIQYANRQTNLGAFFTLMLLW